MQNNFDISQFIKNLGTDLVTVFNRSSEQGNHPDQVGKTKEIKIAKSIEAMLPNGVGIGRGFVFDSYGSISNQYDLILYEKNIIPVFVSDDNEEYAYYPCEGVIAVGEIKSILNKAEFESSLVKLERIKKMKRRYIDNHDFRHFLFSGTMVGADSEIFDPANKCFDNIFTFIFCRDNVMSVDTQLNILINGYRENMMLGVNRIYSLNKQIISKAYLGQEENLLFSNKGCNSYCSIKDENEPFNMLIDNLSCFVKYGRTNSLI